jgi:all-trans-retinol dehydrogenase (NAD+)
MAGLLGSRNLVPYCGSKFAVRGLQEAMSEELRASSNGNSQVRSVLNHFPHDFFYILHHPQIKFTTIFPYAIGTGLFQEFKVRFPSIMPILKPEDAAAAIISAQRRGFEEASIPRELILTNKIFRVFPNPAARLIGDFLSAYVESDKK